MPMPLEMVTPYGVRIAVSASSILMHSPLTKNRFHRKKEEAMKVPRWLRSLKKPVVVTSIPIEVGGKIYDTLLLEVYGVEVIYSDDALEMAQEAISNMKESVSRVLDMILEFRC